MAENVMLKDPSKDDVLRQMNTTPVNLPPPDTKRWVARRKAMIVNAVHSGAMSLEEVIRPPSAPLLQYCASLARYPGSRGFRDFGRLVKGVGEQSIFDLGDASGIRAGTV
jgi:hypothetical protein